MARDFDYKHMWGLIEEYKEACLKEMREMRYVVFSKDALTLSIRTSEHFPCVVNMVGEHTSEDILRRCFKEDFRPADGKKYVIIPVHSDAIVVTFRKPRPQYLVEEKRF